MNELAGRSLHFVGIGGAGMSGLALVARALGAEVTGSDRAESPYSERLRAAGIEPRDRPRRRQRARRRRGGGLHGDPAATTRSWPPAARPGARVLHRGELLGEVSRLKRSIAVGGTHGKTTTAAMAAHALRECGRDPAFLIGGELRSAGTNAAWGEGRVGRGRGRRVRPLVPEARARRGGGDQRRARPPRHLPLACASSRRPSRSSPRPPRLRDRSAPGSSCPATARAPTGSRTGDLRAEDVELRPLGSRFEVDGAPVELRVPGRHNVLNALAALAACRAAGAGAGRGRRPRWPASRGAGRRFEDARRAPRAGARVFDDYAHHPTEVRATLEAARTLGAAARWSPASSPTSTRARAMLAREFGEALALADVVVVLDVYPARERAEDFPGVSGLLVARAAADAARRAAGVVAAHDRRRASGCWRASWGRATCCSRSAPATWTRWRGAGEHGVGAGMSRPEGVERDYPLARLTTVRTGGPADFFARPDSERAAGRAAGLGGARGASR